MYVDPQALVAAAMELESAATRLRGIVSTAQPTLRVLPAGSEEVSGSAANYFNTISGSLASSTDRAIEELTAAAAALRKNAA
ncbi:PE family protein, partial [Rhodococcus erythropolis]|nr:PE family protein [Rhodococcus erythropolis]